MAAIDLSDAYPLPAKETAEDDHSRRAAPLLWRRSRRSGLIVPDFRARREKTETTAMPAAGAGHPATGAAGSIAASAGQRRASITSLGRDRGRPPSRRSPAVDAGDRRLRAPRQSPISRRRPPPSMPRIASPCRMTKWPERRRADARAFSTTLLVEALEGRVRVVDHESRHRRQHLGIGRRHRPARHASGAEAGGMTTGKFARADPSREHAGGKSTSLHR